jgi:phage-related protein
MEGRGPRGSGDCRRSRRDIFRAVYTIRFAEAVYVLHAFQKKSPRGIKTARRDVELVTERLKQARREYQKHYAQE